jgi:hypothetical protein
MRAGLTRPTQGVHARGPTTGPDGGGGRGGVSGVEATHRDDGWENRW